MNITRLALLTVPAIALLSGKVAAQVAAVKLNKAYAAPNEVCIVINPLNPAQVVAATNIHMLYVSADSGRTWLEQEMTSPLGVWGDPVLLFDDTGTLYYAHLSRTPGKKFPEQLDRIVVQTSRDGGHMFSDGVGVGVRNGKVQDKEWLCYDATKTSPTYGRLYMSWTEFDKYGSASDTDRSRIRMAWSANRGTSFTEPVDVSDTTGDCLDSDNTLEGATTAVGPDGTVYVVWSAFGKLYFDRSTDGGKTFDRDRVIAKQPGGWDMELAHMYRTNGMPFLVCDNSTGPKRGRLFACWSDTRNGDADVWLTWSDDKGDTWTPPMRINRDAEKNGSDQFLPHITLDPITGFVYVLFYDRRHSSTGGFLDVYLAISKNGGKDFVEHRLTQSFPAAGKQVFFGDYITVAAYNGMVRPAWTSFNGKLQAEVALISQADLDAQPKAVSDHISKPFVDAATRQWVMHVRAGEPGENEFRIYSGKKVVFASLLQGSEQDIELSKRLEAGTYRAVLLHNGKECSSVEFFCGG